MQVSDKAQQTAKRYFGERAAVYDARRSTQDKWHAEDTALKMALADLPRDTRILDCPCGTGRFFPFYRSKQFDVCGIDISSDMLAQAAKHEAPPVLREHSVFELESLGMELFDVAVSFRFMNLIEASDMQKALVQLQKVTLKRIMFTLRIQSDKPSKGYHHPHTEAEVQAALLPGWSMSAKSLHQHDYRLVTLECALVGA